MIALGFYLAENYVALLDATVSFKCQMFWFITCVIARLNKRNLTPGGLLNFYVNKYLSVYKKGVSSKVFL